MIFGKVKPLIHKYLIAFILIVIGSESAYCKDIQIEHQELKLNATFTHDVSDISNGRIFVILHGTLAHGRMEIIESLQQVLKEEGEKVLAITLSLGINNREGMYACEVPHDHRHEDAQDELAKWLNWLRKHNAQEIILVGHSRGAMQIAEYAANNNKNQIKGAILLAPPLTSKTPLSPDTKPAEIKLANKGPSKKYFKVGHFLHCQESVVSSKSLHSYYGEQSSGINIFESLARISVPTLIFLGSNDPIVNIAAWNKQSDFNENIQVNVIEGAGHFFRDLYLYDIVDEVLIWSE